MVFKFWSCSPFELIFGVRNKIWTINFYKISALYSLPIVRVKPDGSGPLAEYVHVFHSAHSTRLPLIRWREFWWESKQKQAIGAKREAIIRIDCEGDANWRISLACTEKIGTIGARYLSTCWFLSWILLQQNVPRPTGKSSEVDCSSSRFNVQRQK